MVNYIRSGHESTNRGVWHCHTPILLASRLSMVGVVIAQTIAVSILVALPRPGEAANLPAIQRRGRIVIAVKDNVRPLAFRQGSGELNGLEIDIARQLAQELLGQSGQLEFVPVLNQNRISAVLEGDVDMAIARLTVTGSRARLVDFSVPYYVDGTALITRSGTIQEISDLTGQTVAVLNQSSTIAIVRSRLPTVRLLGVESYQDAYRILEAGQADAFAADASVLAGWLQEYPQYRMLPTLLSAEALAIAMPRGLQHDSLRRRVNAIIQGWRQAGWLQQRIQYWGLPQTQPRNNPEDIQAGHDQR